jgi:Protein of unknown function (DUF3043)
VKLLHRKSRSPDVADIDASSEPTTIGTKGRPTPKRRDSTPRRAPITEVPRTRREAYRWQKQQAARAKTSTATDKPVSREAYRAALARGDESVLPRRDQGPLRKLARDWVDSHRMFSNYLLALFPLMIIGAAIPYVTIAVLVLFVAFVGEWYLTGRNVIALARERNVPVRSGPMGLGFYAGSRAYMPRRWRMPAPQVKIGDPI